MSALILPVGQRRTSSWGQHQRRNPKSTEPGTDFYCPIGTEVVAPADGRIYGYGESIIPATGLWVGIELDNGMSFRCMHHSRLIRTGGRVRAGEVIAISGATGYGEKDWSWNPETGGAHTHVTLWPTHDRRFGYRGDGSPYTVDFMDYVGGFAAGGNATPIPKEWDEMASKEEIRNLIREEIGGMRDELVGWLSGLNQKFDGDFAPTLIDIRANGAGLNRKLDESVLPTLERESARAARIESAVVVHEDVEAQGAAAVQSSERPTP